MLSGMRAWLRRQAARLAIVLLLSAAAVNAHASVAADHMGEAAALCLAEPTGGAAAATLPKVAGMPTQQRRPLHSGAAGGARQVQRSVSYRARGDP